MTAVSFYVQVVKALDEIGAPYMIVGAFGGTIYGITRATHDIDIIVDLRETDYEALSQKFPLNIQMIFLSFYFSVCADLAITKLILKKLLNTSLASDQKPSTCGSKRLQKRRMKLKRAICRVNGNHPRLSPLLSGEGQG